MAISHSTPAVTPLFPQDKFHDLVPALDTWSAYIVPLTLIMIGLAGIYESCFKKEEHDDHSHGDMALEGVTCGGRRTEKHQDIYICIHASDGGLILTPDIARGNIHQGHQYAVRFRDLRYRHRPWPAARRIVCGDPGAGVADQGSGYLIHLHVCGRDSVLHGGLHLTYRWVW